MKPNPACECPRVHYYGAPSVPISPPFHLLPSALINNHTAARLGYVLTYCVSTLCPASLRPHGAHRVTCSSDAHPSDRVDTKTRIVAKAAACSTAVQSSKQALPQQSAVHPCFLTGKIGVHAWSLQSPPGGGGSAERTGKQGGPPFPFPFPFLSAPQSNLKPIRFQPSASLLQRRHARPAQTRGAWLYHVTRGCAEDKLSYEACEALWMDVLVVAYLLSLPSWLAWPAPPKLQSCCASGACTQHDTQHDTPTTVGMAAPRTSHRCVGVQQRPTSVWCSRQRPVLARRLRALFCDCAAFETH